MSEQNNQQDKPKGLIVGKRIFVESLLSDEEYRVTAMKYPNTFSQGRKKIPFFHSEDPPWRYQMGQSPSAEEITASALNLERLRSYIINKELAEVE